MKARLIRCSTWLVAALFAVAGLLVLAAASSEAQPGFDTCCCCNRSTAAT